MVVAYRILVSAPVHFCFRSYWDLVGPLGGFGTKGLRTGLDNIVCIVEVMVIIHIFKMLGIFHINALTIDVAMV